MYNGFDLFNSPIEFRINLNFFKKLSNFENNDTIKIENKRNKQTTKICPMKLRSKNCNINLLSSKSNFSSITCDI